MIINIQKENNNILTIIKLKATNIKRRKNILEVVMGIIQSRSANSSSVVTRGVRTSFLASYLLSFLKYISPYSIIILNRF